MKYIFTVTLLLIHIGQVVGQKTQSLTNLILEKGDKTGFQLSSNISSADIIVDKNDSKAVLLAAKLFSEDIERVTGRVQRF